MNYHFVLKSSYDKTAYQALSEASWQLFRKPRLQAQAYPIFFALAALILFTLIYNRGNYDTPFLVGGIAFIAFLIAAVPLSAVSAKAKMYRTAVKAATARGEFPIEIQFVFRTEQIHTTIGQNVSIVSYSNVSRFAALGDWRFLFFGQAAYILHASAFQNKEELSKFEAFITAKCDLPLIVLKGSGPQR